jgi:hypothetical protein
MLAKEFDVAIPSSSFFIREPDDHDSQEEEYVKEYERGTVFDDVITTNKDFDVRYASSSSSSAVSLEESAFDARYTFFVLQFDTVCPSKNETTRMRLFCSSFPMSFSGRSQVRSNSCESI